MQRVYFIVGCTACGKGAVGRHIARRCGGQIVSVDSMKVYRRMDIGTAKPSAEDQAEVPHHCIDVVEPSAHFSVAEYVACADNAITAIAAAGAIPLAVGGTSLYVKALSAGLFEAPPVDPQIRADLQRRADAEPLGDLHAELGKIDPEAAARIHPNDRRRIVRAMEVWQSTGTPISELQRQWDSGRQRYDCVFIGLRRDKRDQSARINRRTKKMIDAGLRDEVEALLAEPAGMAPQAAQAVGYAEMIRHLAGECTLDEAREKIKINTRRLAKKQRTWHRRFPNVQWFDLPPNATPDPVAEQILAAGLFSRPED